MNDVTRILSAIEHGDPQAAEQLLPLVYDELRKLAAAEAGPGEAGPDAPGHGPGPRGVPPAGRTRERAQRWNSRGHFFAAAAEAMRRILVENARRKRRPKHGGGPAACGRSTTPATPIAPPVDDLLALDEALRQLAAEDPASAELVKLRYFAACRWPRPPRPWACRRGPPTALGLRPGLARSEEMLGGADRTFRGHNSLRSVAD